jgi:hypothetical protein
MAKSLDKLFNFLKINTTQNIVGSASDNKILYSSDYDLNEIIKESHFSSSILDKIYNQFLKKFRKVQYNKNLYIIDFKCGLDIDGQPLRWNHNNMELGYKTLKDGRNITFQDCLLTKSTIKMDIIGLDEESKTYKDITEIYFLKIGDESNFLKHDLKKDHILSELEKDMDNLEIVNNNYFKSLKRAYSIAKIEKDNQTINRLVKFFNSPIGLLNKARSDIDILLTVMNQKKFRIKQIESIKNNFKIICNEIKNNFTIDENYNFKTKRDAKIILTKLRNELYNFVNNSSINFKI